MQAVRRRFLPAWYLPNGTKYANENELEGASGSCEAWSIWCGFLVIVCIIAELALAIIEPPYGLFLRLSIAPDAGVAIGIVGEVLFGMWNNRIQTELRTRSNVKLAEATERGAQATKEAAAANERAAEAELQTRRLSSPRMVDAAAFAKAIADAPPAKVQILFSASCPDCSWVSAWLRGGLQSAGWEISAHGALPASSHSFLTPETQAFGNPWGITAAAHSDDFTSAEMGALCNALRAALPNEQIHGLGHPQMPKGIFRLIVAPRP